VNGSMLKILVHIQLHHQVISMDLKQMYSSIYSGHKVSKN
jgi:hypothetical protein